MTEIDVNFPFHLQWLGGRTTIHEQLFASRNAYICLEDMKESDHSVDVVLNIRSGRLMFMIGNESRREFGLSTVKRFHRFPTDPTYFVLEVCEDNCPPHLEVLKGASVEIVDEVEKLMCGDTTYSPPPKAAKTFEIVEDRSKISNSVDDRSEVHQIVKGRSESFESVEDRPKHINILENTSSTFEIVEDKPKKSQFEESGLVSSRSSSKDNKAGSKKSSNNIDNQVVDKKIMVEDILNNIRLDDVKSNFPPTQIFDEYREILDIHRPNVIESNFAPTQILEEEWNHIIENNSDEAEEISFHSGNGEIKIIRSPSDEYNTDYSNKQDKIEFSPAKEKDNAPNFVQECDKPRKVSKKFANAQFIADIIDETTLRQHNYIEGGEVRLTILKKNKKQKHRKSKYSQIAVK